MKIEQSLSKDESVYLELQKLYESYGYQKFRMQKFEEYSFYLDYKNFLASEYILTFPDQNGKLLALRPDVTLSIVKNTKATATSSEKLYYRENVYRMGKSSKTFSEIMQVGVENIGTIDACETAEILMLAAASLEAIEPDYRLSLSHMGFVTGLLATCHAESEKDKQEVLSCLKTKNAHDLYRFLISHAVSEENARNVSNLILFSGDWKQTAALAKKAAIHEEMQKALDELEQIFSLLAGSRYSSHLSLDLTVLSDVDYYNGIIMQGYVRSCPRSVLSGGRYDLLLEKFKHSIGAMGFAVCLGDLNSCYPDESAYDFDTLLVYDSHDKYEQVLARASKLRSEGKKVRISRECQQNLRYEQLEKMDGGSLC